MKHLRLTLFLLLGAACASTGPVRPLHDLFGVTVGMPKEAVHAKLSAVGTKTRDERKRQEVWTVKDPRFEGALVGYDQDWKVRYITAVARADGEQVRFADVLDLTKAEHKSAGASHNYRWTPRGADYAIIAIGESGVKYLSLAHVNEELEEEEEEEDDDDGP